MKEFEFTAWSIYTGPSNLYSIYDGSSWVVGEWNAINDDCSVEEIKKDIDKRIECIVSAFGNALSNYKAKTRFFIIPEFFFRCKQGPYPYLKIEGDYYPLEYIKNKLEDEFLKLIPDDNCVYHIFSGSVLSSNISDYDTFLSSSSVSERMRLLNDCLGNRKEVLFKNIALNKNVVNSWHREILTKEKKEEVNKYACLDDDISDSSNSLDDFMKEARANPLCTVRNRGIYFYCNKDIDSNEIQSFVCEKQNESTVDLTMGVFEDGELNHGGMITEWMANYPSVSILGGDKHIDAFSTNARFSPLLFGSSDVGVEICLDHRKQRLRRTVDMSIANGADADNYSILHQILASGGMQILDYAVAANVNSSIFNADGCDKIYRVYGDEDSVILDGDAGPFTGITTGVYSKAMQSKWIGKDEQTYYSHSQLAFCTNDVKVDGFNNALGLNNIMAKTFTGSQNNPSNVLTDKYEIELIPVDVCKEIDLFGVADSELHNYYEVDD
jgi:hypothetical protein